MKKKPVKVEEPQKLCSKGKNSDLRAECLMCYSVFIDNADVKVIVPCPKCKQFALVRGLEKELASEV